MAMNKKRPTRVTSEPAPQRYDRPGHLDPAHAERLLELSRADRDQDDDEAFVRAKTSKDDFAEELGETAVASMTSGEDALTDELEAQVEEETGGPFIETSGNVEFAGGTDESNIAEATREPLPLANREDDDEEEEEEE
jgi:hypothetical protein